jgi:hypothetical protein
MGLQVTDGENMALASLTSSSHEGVLWHLGSGLLEVLGKFGID